MLVDTGSRSATSTLSGGDGHEVRYSRDVDQLGHGTTDESIAEYAEPAGFAVPSTDAKGSAGRGATVTTFVTPRDMTGSSVR